MRTTRMGTGLAFTPEKDLEMFSTMAAQGKQLSGVSAFGWTFTDAPSEEAIFDLAYEAHPAADYVDLFAAAGWTRVLSAGDLHIFKAAPGTPPVHTSDDSRRDELVGRRNLFAWLGAVAVGVFILVALMLRAVSWNSGIEIVLLLVALVPVIFTVMPLAGFMARLRKLR